MKLLGHRRVCPTKQYLSYIKQGLSDGVWDIEYFIKITNSCLFCECDFKSCLKQVRLYHIKQGLTSIYWDIDGNVPQNEINVL